MQSKNVIIVMGAVAILLLVATIGIQAALLWQRGLSPLGLRTTEQTTAAALSKQLNAVVAATARARNIQKLTPTQTPAVIVIIATPTSVSPTMTLIPVLTATPIPVTPTGEPQPPAVLPPMLVSPIVTPRIATQVTVALPAEGVALVGQGISTTAAVTSTTATRAVIPPTAVLPTATDTPLVPTATAVPPTPTVLVPTATAAPPTPTVTATATVEPVADYVLGYTDAIPGCVALTTIVATILDESYGLTIRQAAARDTAALYHNVAAKGDEATGVDLMVCGSLPDDGSYLRQYDDKLTTVGGAYAKMENHRWYLIMSRATFEHQRFIDTCVFEFFADGISVLGLGNVQLETLDATQWLTENAAMIESATVCNQN